MKTKAQSLITLRYVERGETTRIVVLPTERSGVPKAHVDAGKPLPLDLLAGRPINLELDDDGLSAELCFEGPPIRCEFPWASVVAVQGDDGSLVPTVVVTMAVKMEDESLVPVEHGTNEPEPELPDSAPPGPGLRLVRDRP